jgi:hypothetical protein
MPLFQQSALKKYLNDLDKQQLQKAWLLFAEHFLNPVIQQNISSSKEEEYQEGFVRDLFVNVLGYTLKPGEFLKELQKQKIKLTLPEQQEWLQYFEEQKLKANNIQQTIQQTDKEIDEMVYELYGLSEEEIAIVEGK